MEYYMTVCDSPVGRLTLASGGESLAGLWLEGQKYFLGGLFAQPLLRDDLAVFEQARRWLDRYFAGQKPSPFELSLAPEGSGFRREVWKCLCEIPYGETTTYKAIAKKIAGRLGRASMSAQAVGGAVAHNPISIIIPCHRVLGTDGSLTGYAGGLERKKQLLLLEGVKIHE